MKELAEQVLQRVLAADGAAEVEVAVDRHQLALTRFATSVIHQNVAEDVTTVRVARPPRRANGIGVDDGQR